MGKEVSQNSDVEYKDNVYKYFSALMEITKQLMIPYKENLSAEFIDDLSGFDDKKWVQALFDNAINDAPGLPFRILARISRKIFLNTKYAVFTFCLLDDIVATLQYEVEAMDMYHSAQTEHQWLVTSWDVSQYNQQAISQIEKKEQKAEYSRAKMLELYSCHRVFYLQCLTGGNDDADLVERLSLTNVINEQGVLNRARQLRKGVIKKIPRNRTIDILPLLNFWEDFRKRYATM